MAKRIVYEFPYKIGEWMVIGDVESVIKYRRLFWVVCPKCGKKVKKAISNAKRDKGCFNCSLANKKHGLTKTREHRIWRGMRSRCYNKKDNAYKYYGGRGIQICERWNEFVKFFVDMGKSPGIDYSLDRINSRGNYCKENCRWITISENTKRMRREYLHISKKDLKKLSKESLSILGLTQKDLEIKEAYTSLR